MGNQKYDAIWVEGSFFEKGHWKLVPKGDNGIGALIVVLFAIFLLCLIILVSPLIIALIGFSIVKHKRYYASIFSLLASLYLYIDYQNKWITGLIIFGRIKSNGEFSDGILGYDLAPMFFIANSLAIGLSVYFIINSIFYFNNFKSENNFTLNPKQNFISVLMGILFFIFLYTYSKNVTNELKQTNSEVNNEENYSVKDYLEESIKPIDTFATTGNFYIDSSDLENDSLIDSDINNKDYEYSIENNDVGDNSDTHEEVIPFGLVEEVPVFPGCEGVAKNKRLDCFMEQMSKHIKKNLLYPEKAMEENVQGRVNVLFDINIDGNVTNVQVKGPKGGELLENEARRVIEILPKLKPGIHNANPVNVRYSELITFKLQ